MCAIIETTKHRSTHTHTLLLKIAKCNVCSSAMSSIILAPQTLQRSLSTSERSLPNMEKGHLLLATCGVNMLYISSNSRDSVVKMAPGDSLLCTKARFLHQNTVSTDIDSSEKAACGIPPTPTLLHLPDFQASAGILPLCHFSDKVQGKVFLFPMPLFPSSFPT